MAFINVPLFGKAMKMYLLEKEKNRSCLHPRQKCIVYIIKKYCGAFYNLQRLFCFLDSRIVHVGDYQAIDLRRSI